MLVYQRVVGVSDWFHPEASGNDAFTTEKWMVPEAHSWMELDMPVTIDLIDYCR